MLDFQVGLVIKNVQIKPAAKKPLYNPWFAANALVGVGSADGATIPSGVTLQCTSPDIGCTCFSGDTTVQVQGKGAVPMKELHVNDQVLVGKDSNNKPIYQPVYGFGHHETSTPKEFLQIHTSPSSGKPLELSAIHLLYVQGKKDPVRADSIEVGDVLVQTSVEDSTKVVKVTKVKKVVREGAYMPLTKDGTVVVNNILASSYVSILDEAPEVVSKYLSVFSDDQLLHWWLAPYRMVCQGMPSLCMNDKNEEGIAYWLVFGKSLAKMANGWGFVAQIVGVVVVGLFMAFCMGLEASVAFFGTVPGAVAGVAALGLANKMIVGGKKKIV